MHEELKTLDQPALIIWGANDTVTPPDVALQFEECLQHSVLHYLPECGHCAPYEKPKECLGLIESFLTTPSHRRVLMPSCAA